MNRLKLLFVVLLFISMPMSKHLVDGQQSRIYADEGFEKLTEKTTISGGTVNTYGIWYDGGTAASTKTTASYAGTTSMVLEALTPSLGDYVDANGNYVDVDEEAGKSYVKRNYGSIYTESLDLTQAGSVSFSFVYLLTNSAGYSELSGNFRVDVSVDGGESFTKLVAPPDLTPIRNFATATSGDWKYISVNLPRAYRTQNTVLRIKSYFDDNLIDDTTKLWLDEVVISYTGTQPYLSRETIVPENDAPIGGRELYDEAGFDADDDWGVWTDGGRDVYLTSFLAETGASNVVIRDRYNIDPTELDSKGQLQGEWNDLNDLSIGREKRSYSSILTKNIDLTRVDDLQIEFSFVPYGIGISDRIPDDHDVTNTYFELLLSINAGVDYESIATWRAGEHYIDQERYKIIKTISGDSAGSAGFTTSTIIKIQAYGRSETDQIYIDNVKLFSIGSRVSPAGSPIAFDDGNAIVTMLQADTSQPTYDLINNTFIEEYDPNTFFNVIDEDATDFDCLYGAVEHSDVSHPGFGEHIMQEYDADLGKDVFTFHAHQDDHSPFVSEDNRAIASPDTDRCRTDGKYNDRQRIEFKTYKESPDTLLGVKGETHLLSWKMKLPDDFQASDKFTHLHQLKPVGGDGAKMPLITLTAVSGKPETEFTDATPALLNLRYSPSHVSQVTITSAPLSELTGKWIHIVEKVKFGLPNEGRYEIMILDANDLEGEPIMQFASYSLPTWKIDDEGEYVRGKWGIYRSIVQGDKLKDEIVRFADVTIAELHNSDAEYTNLIDFAYYANSISGGNVPEQLAPESDIVGTSGADIIHLSQGASSKIQVSVNGVITELTPHQATLIKINSGAGDDRITVDPDVTYGELLVYGGLGDDIIIGGNGKDFLHGEDGEDWIFGRTGDDTINGGNGNDQMAGLYGLNTIINTGGSKDRLVANVDDILQSGSTIWRRWQTYTALGINAKGAYLDVLFEHLDGFKQPTDEITLSTNAYYSNSLTDFVFSGTEDLDAAISGSESYSFIMRASRNALIEYEIIDYLTTDSSTALNQINSYIVDLPSEYGPYVLWRLGDITIARAKYVFDTYVGNNGGIFELTKDIDGNHAFIFEGQMTTWHPANQSLANVPLCTEGNCAGDPDIDMRYFRDHMETFDSIDSYYGGSIQDMQDVFGASTTIQVVDAPRAAEIILENWGNFGIAITTTTDSSNAIVTEVESVSLEDIQMSLGYIPVTEGKTAIYVPQTNSELRGALAYATVNIGFFNAMDTGATAGGLDNKLTKSNVESFISVTKSTIESSWDWLRAEEEADSYDKYAAVRNVFLVALMMNYHVLDATAATTFDSGEAGWESNAKNNMVTYTDLLYFAEMSEQDIGYSDFVKSSFALLEECSAFVMRNPLIKGKLDTGSTIFNWSNRPDGNISFDEMKSGASSMPFSPSTLVQYTRQSQMLRVFTEELQPSSADVKRNIGNLLMAWNGYELIYMDPTGGSLADGAAGRMEDAMIAVTALSAGHEPTAQWLSDGLVDEFEYWFAKSPSAYNKFEEYVGEDVADYLSLAEDGLIEGVLAETEIEVDGDGVVHDIMAAMSLVQNELRALQLFPKYEDVYDEAVEYFGFALLFTILELNTDNYDESDYEEYVYNIAEELVNYFKPEAVEHLTTQDQIDFVVLCMDFLVTSARTSKNFLVFFDNYEGFQTVARNMTGLSADTTRTLWSSGAVSLGVAGITALGLVINAIQTGENPTPAEIQTYVILSIAVVVDLLESRAVYNGHLANDPTNTPAIDLPDDLDAVPDEIAGEMENRDAPDTPVENKRARRSRLIEWNANVADDPPNANVSPQSPAPIQSANSQIGAETTGANTNSYVVRRLTQVKEQLTNPKSSYYDPTALEREQSVKTTNAAIEQAEKLYDQAGRKSRMFISAIDLIMIPVSGYLVFLSIEELEDAVNADNYALSALLVLDIAVGTIGTVGTIIQLVGVMGAGGAVAAAGAMIASSAGIFGTALMVFMLVYSWYQMGQEAARARMAYSDAVLLVYRSNIMSDDTTGWTTEQQERWWGVTFNQEDNYYNSHDGLQDDLLNDSVDESGPGS